MGVFLALLLGACIGMLLVYLVLFLEFLKNKNNETQDINIELEYLLDQMSPRDFYIHKISQTSLKWDPETQTYTKTEQ